MVAIVTSNFRVRNAADFVTSVGDNNYYMFLGQVSPWADDGNPPLPLDIVSNVDWDYWDDMLGFKRIGSNDVVHAINRYDWVSGTVYDQYDPEDSALRKKRFYVMTDEYHVFKVIDNNSGAASTAKPLNTGANVFTTADGYKWKYMYTIPTGDVIRFMTPTHIPVRATSTIDNTGSDGLTPVPYGGHGFDTLRELHAFYVMMNIRMEYDEGGALSTSNDFRRVGIVENPYLFGTTTVANSTAYRQTTKLNISGATGTFTVDETITEGGNSAVVVEHDVSNNILYVTNVVGSFSAATTVTGGSSGNTATVDSVEDPELEPNSGEMIYVEHRSPTSRHPDQVESLTIVLEF